MKSLARNFKQQFEYTHCSFNQQGAEAYCYCYQGQFAEEDHETGWNQFEARMYDSRIGWWMTTDPAEEFYSPYLEMGNRWPISIDMLGQDIIIQTDHKGAIGFLGHSAVLIGDDNGWFYYSMNGTKSFGPIGKDNLPDLGQIKYKNMTIDEMINEINLNSNSPHQYSTYLRIITSTTEDEVAKIAAKKAADRYYHHLPVNTCVDVTLAVMKNLTKERFINHPQGPRNYYNADMTLPRQEIIPRFEEQDLKHAMSIINLDLRFRSLFDKTVNKDRFEYKSNKVGNGSYGGGKGSLVRTYPEFRKIKKNE